MHVFLFFHLISGQEPCLETRNIILTIKNKMRTEYKIYSIHLFSRSSFFICEMIDKIFFVKETFICESIWNFFQLSGRIAFFYFIHSKLTLCKKDEKKNWQWKTPVFCKLLPKNPFWIFYHQFSQFPRKISVTIIHLF